MEDEKLRQIAEDLVNGKIFSDRHLKNKNLLLNVFLPLAMMSPEDRKDFAKKVKPVLIYEYMDKALSRGIDGNPCFPSFQSLNETDFKRMSEHYEVILAAVKKGAPPANPTPA